MKYALLFMAASAIAASIASFITALIERRRRKNKDIVSIPFKRIEYNPMQEIIRSTESPYNENTDGDIDAVKHFYPAARIIKK